MNQTELLMSGRQVVIGGLGVSRSVYDLALVITRGLGSVFTLTVGTVKMMCILSKGVFYILSATGKWVKFRICPEEPIVDDWVVVSEEPIVNDWVVVPLILERSSSSPN